jgi:hypothetical protein
LFKDIETIGQALVKNVTKLLDKHDLRKKNITYVKDEGCNFNIMTIALESIVSCEFLGLEESF